MSYFINHFSGRRVSYSLYALMVFVVILVGLVLFAPLRSWSLGLGQFIAGSAG